MYAEVVVLTYQPPDISAYTYHIPKGLEKEIRTGQLVSVPFGKRTPIGVVIGIQSIAPDPQIETKAITSVILKNPILLPYQVELMRWMASYYFAPMVNCLEAMLPEIPHQPHALMANLSQNPPNSIRGQTIVLVPSISRIPETLAKHPHAKNYAIYHNELSTSQRFALWQKIISGEIDHIFGSRSTIFTPCPNLKEIIIYDEHEEGYVDQRSPYYSTLTVAEKISGLTEAKIKIIDSSPRITTYFRFSASLSVIADPKKNKTPSVKIVDMLDERKAGNKSPLSQILEEYIKKGSERDKKILLFLNKKSESGHLYCRNCKYSDFAAKPPEVCPECQSPDIFFNSINISSLAGLVKKLLPYGNINIITKAAKSPASISARSIDIATASVFYKLLPQKYDLVAHIQTDSLTNITDFSSGEKLYSQIESLKKIAKGLLLLQTYNPQNHTIASAAQSNWQKFYQSQLAERKALSYPPFTLLVKLSTKGKKEEGLEEKSQILYQNLQAANSTVQILGPYKPVFTGKLSKYNIILKIPLNGYLLKDRETAIAEISPLLSKVPKFWQVEVQTNSLN